MLIGVDIGGTFTDIVLMDAAGNIHLEKTSTTPEDQSIGFIDGIGALARGGSSLPDVSHVFHGTTVATNAILEGKGAVAALVTSDGFRHVLAIGRHDIPRKENMFTYVKPKRPVPPQRIYEVGGRILPDGTELEPLDLASVHRAAEQLASTGVKAIAVCLLHSYANAAHEAAVRTILLEHIPDALISLSSEVLPAFREYERSMATLLNAYVMPSVSSYLTRLGDRMQARSIAAPLLMMRSSGGMMGAATARREPIQTALSGPAAGAMGAADVARAASFERVISFDMGGTSADICLIVDGKPAVTTRGRVGDWPLQVPMIDIVTIGAGGGSIAEFDGKRRLKVGPRSAGAVPGPACYSRGGQAPTVTDANLVLGRLAGSLLGDSFPLDAAASEAVIRREIADPMGVTVHKAAEGIIEVVDNAMRGAIRLISVERGLDPGQFALLPFGGAGPLHSSSLARLLGMKTVIVPPNPGVLAAYGLLVADMRSDFTRTALQKAGQPDLDQMASIYAELDGQARSWLRREQVREPAQSTEWHVDLRYKHQGFELTVPWPGQSVTPEALAAAFDAFHALHQRLYTFAQRDTPIEVVTLRVTAIGRIPRPRSAVARSASAGAGPRPHRMYVDGAMIDARAYSRDALAMGDTVAGPAIVTQRDSTLVLLPGDTARVTDSGSIVVDVRLP